MRELTITELKPLFEEFGLGPNVRNLTLVREIARLRAKVVAQSAVVEAAKAFNDDPIMFQPEIDLRAAVATFRAQEQK
jgi:hypothetical protein